MKTFAFFIALLGWTLAAQAQDFKVAGLTFKVPPGWTGSTPSSTMRAGQWIVPSVKLKADPADVVAFYFGQGQGGDTLANINRWLSQITSPEGAPVAAAPVTRTIQGLKITQVVAYGTYASSTMTPGVPPVQKPAYGFCGVVIEGPQGNVFFRLTGPETVIKQTLPAFTKFIDSVSVGS